MQEKLVIIDFSTEDVDIYPIDSTYEPEMEKLLESLGHNPGICQWMFLKGNITTHNKELNT